MARWSSLRRSRAGSMRSPTAYPTTPCRSSARARLPTRPGVHVDAVSKNPATYEHVDPASVGNDRRFLISELAGGSSVVQKARSIDIDLTKQSPEVKAVLDRVVQLEHDGYSFEDAEASFELLLKKAMGQYQQALRAGRFQADRREARARARSRSPRPR